MANHQTLADWLYIWSFTYLATKHTSILITLKSSLKWLPVRPSSWPSDSKLTCNAVCRLGMPAVRLRLPRAELGDRQGAFQDAARARIRTTEEQLRGGQACAAYLSRRHSRNGEHASQVSRSRREARQYVLPPSFNSLAHLSPVPDLKHTLLPRSTGLFFTSALSLLSLLRH